MMVVADFFICWLERFSADQAVGSVVVFPQLLLGQPFHRDFVGQVLSTDGGCGQDLSKNFSAASSPIFTWDS